MKGKRILAALLAALLLFSVPVGACAAGPSPAPEEEESSVVVRRITTQAEFLRFARSCARESYSSGVRFVLETDIDLEGAAFEGVPYFVGEFDGGGHSVSGLALTRAGSRLGLFRQIGETGSVHDLAVSGRVAPSGSREFVGGLCGVNEGTIKSCSFTGEVRGVNDVGGLVGLNKGNVALCRAEIRVCGEHRVGGLAGKNEGLILSCESAGEVNTEEITPSGESGFDLSTLSQEDFVDLGDIALVAGENAGVLRSCSADGAVGYHYTGYNVGGIAGKNSGLVDDCLFAGSVEGRRDVGGIVGQNIPYAVLTLSDGKLKELKSAITALTGLLNAASSTIGTLSSTLASQLSSMSSLSTQAMNAATNLVDGTSVQTSGILSGISVDLETGEVTLPSVNSISSDTSALTSALVSLFSQVQSVSNSLEDASGDVTADWQKIFGQMSYIFTLFFSMIESIGNGDLLDLSDVSYAEAYEHDEGAVARCVNRGSVRAEQNAGGIVGCVAFELSFDQEDTLSAADYLPTNAEQLIFAVVRASRNSGTVQSRGDCAGGVVGRMDIGAAVDCVSTGRIGSQSGLYVGGVAGRSDGTLARCTSRCLLEGSRYVGGAAGLGKNVTDCRAWTHIARAEEYAGALAGWCEGTVSGNLYVTDGVEGVDGVARIGQADPVTRSEFLATAGLPEGLETVCVRFYVGGELYETRSVPFGGALDALPEVAERSGAAWVWDDFDSTALYCDTEVSGAYLEPLRTISSGEEFPLFLVEGEFFDGQTLDVQPFGSAPAQGESLGGYTLRVEGYRGELTVRMRSDGGAAVSVPDGAGGWRTLESEWDGRYLVFRLDNGGSFAVTAAPAERHDGLMWIAGGAAALLLAVLGGRALVRRKRAKAAKAAEED